MSLSQQKRYATDINFKTDYVPDHSKTLYLDSISSPPIRPGVHTQGADTSSRT